MTLTLECASAILASNASALGVDVDFIGRIGTDSFGEYWPSTSAGHCTG